MVRIDFFEKPGCGGNAKQKALLLKAGHELVVHDLLTTPWTREELRSYFGERPVSDWFNRSAPRVKAGDIVPEELDEETALSLMLSEPLLIRRPLLRVGERLEVGFEPKRLADWLLPEETEANAPPVETCLHTKPCPTPTGNPDG
jgi:nitrogenase-associated protein